MNPIYAAKKIIKTASFLKTSYDAYQVGQTVFKGYQMYKNIKDGDLSNKAKQITQNIFDNSLFKSENEQPMNTKEKIEKVKQRLHR